jgi:hypothetical protein
MLVFGHNRFIGNVKMLDYGSLSRHERLAAKKLARQLLETVPAAEETETDGPCSIRGAISTAYMKPENVVGALVYTDGNGNWWGDVVFNKGKKWAQTGTPEDAPAQSSDDALKYVTSMIAYVKAMREHPFVKELREKGCDPEQVELLRVGRAKFGHRWVIMDDDQIRTGAEAFVEYVKDKMPAVVNAVEQARKVILEAAPKFATDMFLHPSADQDGEEGEFQLLHDAAAFLLRCGILNVDEDTTEACFGLPNGETISQQPTLH